MTHSTFGLSYRKMAGQSMVEYLMATAVLVGVLFWEVDGEDALINVIASAIQRGHSNFTIAISVPN